MKKCDRLEKTLYNDSGEFERIMSGQSDSLGAHIKTCGDCAAYFAMAQKTQNMLNGLSGSEENINFKIQDEQAKIFSKLKAARASVKTVKSEICVNARPSVFDMLLNALKPARLAAALALLLIAALIYLGLTASHDKDAKNQAVNAVRNEDKLYTIDKLSAKAYITLNGVNSEIKEAVNISKGGIIKTEAGCVCELSSKYVKVKLQPLTTVILDELCIQLLSGRSLMEFDKTALVDKKPFIVTVDKINVEITGTAIEADLDGETASIKLIEGKIKISSPSIAAVNNVKLKPGEKLTANPSAKTFKVFNAYNAVIKKYPEDKSEKANAPAPETGKNQPQKAVTTAPAIVNVTREAAGTKEIIIDNYINGATNEIKLDETQPEINNGASPFQSN